jgi:hypothetical protein
MAKKGKSKPAAKPSRKPKKARKTAPERSGEAPRSKITDQQIASSTFDTLIRTVRNRQGEMDIARASMGNAVGIAVKRNFLNKRAFGVIKSWLKLSDGELALVLKAFDHMRKISGLDERANRQIEAFAEAEMNGAEPLVPNTMKRAKKQKANGVHAAEPPTPPEAEPPAPVPEIEGAPPVLHS